MSGRASDRVYAQLRQAIDTGTIAPGQRMREVEIAEQFAVSRTPVREALIRLAREGVLERAERGFGVPHDDRQSFFERIDARRLLDVEIARRAAVAAVEHGAPDALDTELANAEAAHAAADPAAFAQAHYALRDAVRLLSGNRLLARCAELVDDSFRVGRERLYQVEAYREVTLDADRRLVEAIRHGDPDTAVAVTERFLGAIEELAGKRLA
jgi:DNA-binding GntR family transcriptional regulator